MVRHSGTHSFSRQELYDLVWKKPISVLAREFGMSDRGLAKACQRHDIPVPERGYWAKLQHGKKVVQRPLPAAGPGSQTVSIQGQRGSPSDLQPAFAALQARITESALKMNEDEDHALAHALTNKTENALQRGRTENGLLIPRKGMKSPDVSVSRESLKRAMTILDRILCLCDEFEMAVTLNESDSIEIDVVGEQIEVEIREVLERSKHIPTHSEQREMERHSWHRVPEFDYVPSGALSFRITNASGLGVRQSWSDGKVQRLENCIEGILMGLASAANARLLEDRRRAEQARVWQRQAEAAERLRKKRLLQEERGLIFKDMYERWRQAEELKKFLSGLRNRRDTEQKSGDESLESWINWAQAYLATIDPLQDGLTEFPTEVSDRPSFTTAYSNARESGPWP